jgi:hypothetical protein
MISGPGFIPTFLYYFVSTTLIVALVVDQGTVGGLPDALGNPFQVGILFGLLAGSLGGYFNGYEELELPINNRGGFTQRLTATLEQMGYEKTQTIDEVMVYQRSGAGQFFAGKVFVQLEGNAATISARGSKIRQMKRALAVKEPT